GELVLESFVSVVGVGEVVRIRAHPELPHLLPPHLPRNEQRRERRQQDGPPQRPRSPILLRSNCHWTRFHRTRFHGPACGCRPSPPRTGAAPGPRPAGRPPPAPAAPPPPSTELPWAVFPPASFPWPGGRFPPLPADPEGSPPRGGVPREGRCRGNSPGAGKKQ